MIEARIREHPTIEEHQGTIERNLAAPWWDTLSPSVIYANAAQVERAMHADGRRRARTKAEGVSDNLRWLESLMTSDDPILGGGPFVFDRRGS